MANEDQKPNHIDPYEHLAIALNPDGTLTRNRNFPVVPATDDDVDQDTIPVLIKDVTLNPDRQTRCRIFRPSKLPHPQARLPIILYFHGGYFLLYGADTGFCNDLCQRVARLLPCVTVSIDYRLAPEHRLPAPYEDAEDALHWLKNQALDSNGEPWLRDFADFSRCFLFGWNSGGNIALKTKLRALDLDLEPVRIIGLMMTQPLFGGIKRTPSELKYADDNIFPLTVSDLLWELALPVGADRDHHYCNPLVEGPNLEKLKSLGKCLVRGYGGDITIDRQRELVEALVKLGVKVVARFDDVGFHGIDLIDPRRAVVTLNYLKEFVYSS